MSHDNVEKLSGIIPEAWYDLISKVVPGTVIVLASFPGVLGSGSSFGGFAVGLVVAYVVGFVFEVISDFLFGWVLKIPGCVLTKLCVLIQSERILTTRGRILTKLGSFMDWIYCYPYRKLWEEIEKQRTPRFEALERPPPKARCLNRSGSIGSCKFYLQY